MLASAGAGLDASAGAAVVGAVACSVAGSVVGAAVDAAGTSAVGASAGVVAPLTAGFGAGAPAGREAARRRRVAGAAATAPFSVVVAGPAPPGAAAMSGSGSCGAGLPPDWRSLIAAMRSPLRMPVMSGMFSSPANWRSSASTMPERPRLRGAAVLTSSVSLKVVLPDLPGVMPGSANSLEMSVDGSREARSSRPAARRTSRLLAGKRPLVRNRIRTTGGCEFRREWPRG